MYKVIFEIYGEGILFEGSFADFKIALAIYNGFRIPEDWTRHPSCDSEIIHMDMRTNLFNEGALQLKNN